MKQDGFWGKRHFQVVRSGNTSPKSWLLNWRWLRPSGRELEALWQQRWVLCLLLCTTLRAQSLTHMVTHAWDSGSCQWTNLEEMPNWLSRGTTEKDTGANAIRTPEVTVSWDLRRKWDLELGSRAVISVSGVRLWVWILSLCISALWPWADNLWKIHSLICKTKIIIIVSQCVLRAQHSIWETVSVQ